MRSDAAWRELHAREGTFRKLFVGEWIDHVPARCLDGGLNQIRPELLIVERDRDAWFGNQFGAVKTNVEEVLDSASLF